MTKIFITGATGYIGGDALYAMTKAHPEYEITCLVRNSDKGALIAQQYPSVRLVYGDLSSSALLADEAARADVVCNFADCDSDAAATAIAQGLARKPASAPGYLVHVSGTAILALPDVQLGTFGVERKDAYDDWDGVSDITSLPDSSPHRNVDKIVLGLAEKARTAIVCPPTIYGAGRGPGNQRSIQVNKMAEATLKRGVGFMVREGTNRWCEVHVHDLSDLFLKLVEDAASGGKLASWGSDGYYFAENGDFSWGHIAKEVAQEAHKQGFIKGAQVESLSIEETNDMVSFGAFLWGSNSIGRAIRARKLLNWTPKARSLLDEIPDVVAAEAKLLGLAK